MKKNATTEEKILEAGRHLFSKSGYVATSMSDIANEVGITKASLYYFFKNKQALYIQILLDLINRASEIYDKDPSKKPEGTLKNVILEIVAVSKEHGSILQNMDSSKLDTQSMAFKVIVEKQMALDKKIQVFLKKCGIEDTKLASHTLNSSTHGYVQRLLFDINDISAEKFAAYMSRLLIK